MCEACGLPSILTHLGSGGPPPPPTKPNIKARLHHSSLEHVTSLSRAREAPGDISPLLLEMVTILLPKPTSLQSNAEPRRPISEKRTFTRLSETTAQTLGQALWVHGRIRCGSFLQAADCPKWETETLKKHFWYKKGAGEASERMRRAYRHHLSWLMNDDYELTRQLGQRRKHVGPSGAHSPGQHAGRAAADDRAGSTGSLL